MINKEQREDSTGAGGEKTGYQIESLGSEDTEWDEMAEFLADFVKRGELSGASDRDLEAACWKERMGWWWKENPFCGDGSPLGFRLRSADGEVVGFHGVIPFDYEAGGTVIPGLISSIFFVRSDHRSGSMPLFLRVQRLAARYHLVDGGPSDDVIQILERFGYQQGGKRKFYAYPVGFGWGSRLKAGLRLIADPSEIVTIPEREDGRIRPQVSIESLAWMAGVGSGKRQFFGVCDEGGNLVAYALGLYKGLPGGFKRCQIVDYGSFDEGRCSVSDLLKHVAGNRKRIPLARKTFLLVWGVENGAARPRRRIGIERDSKVFFHGPRGREATAKAVLPIEGDFSFF